MVSFNIDESLSKYVRKPDPLAKPEEILLYSQAGSGKTYLAATAANLPGVHKVLYVDTEGSTVGVVSQIEHSDKIDIVRVDQMEHPFAWFNTFFSDRVLFKPGAETSYDVIVIDTFDVAQAWAVQYFTENAPIGQSGHPDTFATWGNVKTWSLNIANRLKSHPALAIIVMHDREEKADSGAITKRLSIQGSAKDVFPGIPDVVAYLERVVVDGKPTTIAYFGTSDNKVTKDRFNFPPKVANVTLPGLFKFIDTHGARAKVAASAHNPTQTHTKQNTNNQKEVTE